MTVGVRQINVLCVCRIIDRQINGQSDCAKASQKSHESTLGGGRVGSDDSRPMAARDDLQPLAHVDSKSL